jgi:hypothetical protein
MIVGEHYVTPSQFSSSANNSSGGSKAMIKANSKNTEQAIAVKNNSTLKL